MVGTIFVALVAVVVGFLIVRLGLGVLRSFSTPIPPPPPPGELRKVNLRYRCSICGTEIKMTLANDELPDPPRHCQEEMDIVAPIME